MVVHRVIHPYGTSCPSPVLSLYYRPVVRLSQSSTLLNICRARVKGVTMVRKTQLFILLFSTIGFSLLTSSAGASPATLKCNSNHDQVWVYDSLNSFNVDAKLK